MKLTYFGTAAAEGWPAIFCNCELCKEARQLKGKNIRTRSQALVNDDLLIDFPPDTYMHYLTYNFNLPEITELLVTHSHTDHFYATDLEMRCVPLAHPQPKIMHIYCNDKVEKKFYDFMPTANKVADNFEIVHATPFVPIQVKDYTVIPLLANHDKTEECLIYLITQNGKTILYGNDSGIFPQATFDCIKWSGLHIDLASFDCTMQSKKEGNNHMGLIDVVETRKKLVEIGAVNESTICVVNHFSHNGLWNHERMEKEAKRHGLLTAYDGMEIVLRN